MTVINSFSGENSWLSNFFPAQVTLDGVLFPTVEHAFQAAKTFDPSERDNIKYAKTPGKAKGLGRAATLRPDWEEVKVGVMRQLLAQKFRTGTPLAEKLLATGDAQLVEGNWWGDTFWGVCKGKGQNWLGRLLTEQRQALSQPRSKP